MERSRGTRLDLTIYSLIKSILQCDHSNKSYWAVLVCGTVRSLCCRRGLNLFVLSVWTQEMLFEWNPTFSKWAILSFFSDSPTSCSLERWRWTTLKKSQTLPWEQIKRLETLSLPTIIQAPRKVHRLVLKKRSKVKKKNKNKNRDQSELEAIYSCRFWVWENYGGWWLLSLSRSTGRFSLKKYKADAKREYGL